MNELENELEKAKLTNIWVIFKKIIHYLWIGIKTFFRYLWIPFKFVFVILFRWVWNKFVYGTFYEKAIIVSIVFALLSQIKNLLQLGLIYLLRLSNLFHLLF
ncbi:hypothetical protein DESAMIL20_659 [Desulfurella amilsii]|uniref:Uncharacterized protein n=1 Tax=Desulfurella amilsii TaxID=1562698 RepID=A0A1X4XYF7_9BACT|nr:hypothetical protein [Desulfurella amilsii]OSS42544.1 hypothetical protein DESAMIL20_659 [Desulfurella amilsii]